MSFKPTLRGWKLLVYAVFLGPFFLAQYFQETRTSYPNARYFGWISLLLLLVCAYLLFALTLSPFLMRLVYGVLYLAVFGLAFMYCWVMDSKTKSRMPGPKQKYSFTRAVAWMLVMGILFQGLNNIVQAIYYWLLGEQISVYFSAEANIFKFWLFMGLIFGFAYGIREGQDYFNRSLRSIGVSVFFVFLLIALFNGIILLLLIYPLQRLAPISYQPQSSDFIFYLLLFIAMALATIRLIGTGNEHGILKKTGLLLVGIPMIALHVIIVSAYAVTINLTIASILEDRQKLDDAKALYAKAIPHIRYNRLLAALHHRKGVLQVLNQDYDAALASFKKVMTDYSESYGVYQKARRYVDSFEHNRASQTLGRKIIPVRHRTFEQAASCFPNSLSVILNFYETQPISTRKLSYAIKESFGEGTFIWKAESFLEANGYTLVTTFWQDKDTLIALLEDGYPILVYIPGHVYTLYGYDARMEMFFTYDTAKSNRWNDKPFWTFQRNWMKGSFLMSVVVPKGDAEKFAARYPQLERYTEAHRVWQKAQISNYYAYKENYWRDYDPLYLSRALGLDRLKLTDMYYMDEDYDPLPWDAGQWDNDVAPVLSRPWAMEWSILERYLLYLLDSEQPAKALELIARYESHLAAEAKSPFYRLLELKLAAAVKMKHQAEILSIADKMIGIAGNKGAASYWGHYYKARRLMAAGDLKGAAELTLPILNGLRLGYYERSASVSAILDILDQIERRAPSLIEPDKHTLIEVARIQTAWVDGANGNPPPMP